LLYKHKQQFNSRFVWLKGHVTPADKNKLSLTGDVEQRM